MRSPLDTLICKEARPDLSVSDLCKIVSCERTAVYRCITRYHIQLKQRTKPDKKPGLTDRILSFPDKTKTSREVAEILGCSARHVQNVLRLHEASRLPRGSRTGKDSSSYRFGRRIDRDGYVLVSAPIGHPTARRCGAILEHRLVLEKKLGRYLLPSEIVDHIDGLHLHNDPANLRVFSCNADHLRATISGQVPKWSHEGLLRMCSTRLSRSKNPQVQTYRNMKKCGDARLIQILRALLVLGKDSPFLLGSSPPLEKAGILDLSRSNLERELERICRKYA